MGRLDSNPPVGYNKCFKRLTGTLGLGIDRVKINRQM